jgi:serine/threonine protein kinase
MNGYLYLAQEKYIHGNLKPSSIFIKDKIIKISGFTNARKINKDKDIRRELKYNHYQSPESIKEYIFNHKSDIWSLAMILYVLLHAHFPWDFTNKN